MQHIGTRKIAASGLWLTASFALAKILQLLAQIFLARLLTPKDFGLWGIVLIMTTLSALFKDVAIATVLVHRGLDDKKLVDAVYSLGVNISVAMFMIQVLSGFPLAQFFHEPLVLPLSATAALIFLISAGAGSHGAVLQRQMKFRDLAIADSGAGFARFAGAVICAAFGGGVWSFVVAEIAMATVDALLKRWLSKYQFTYHLIPDQSALQEVKGYVSSLIGIDLAVYVNTNGDNLIIGKLLGPQSLGYYNLAYQLAMLPAFALSQINRINFSVLSQRDQEGQKAYLSQILEIYALLYAPIYGVAFVVAPWIIPSIYGSQWNPVVKLFQIILIFAYARGFMSILGVALIAANKADVNAAINWTLIPLSLPAYFFGAKFGGSLGVAMAVALVMGVGATIWFWLVTCRAAGWNIGVLIKPIFLPTVTVVVTVVAVQANLSYIYLQPVFIFCVYGIAMSVFSLGRIKRMFILVIKRSLSK
ncbi:MAG: oligosaccharide flippase family protein [Rhizonema sp. PD37]|nr:oligosaccharide flippase family protein [Rhizonema sp. PD37]